MKKLSLLLLIGAAFFSCKKDDPGKPLTTVNLRFKAVYDGQPFMTYQNYTYPDNQLIRFLSFNYFISNVALLPADGSGEVSLADVGFVDFSDNTTLEEAETPVVFTREKVPAGTYKGLKISIGVPAELNNADAGNLSPDNPLKKNFVTHFWSDWKSFIFMKSEGVYDLDGDGTFSANDRGFEHHAGTDAVYQSFTILKSLEISAEKPFDLNLVTDVLKIYVRDGNYLDLADPANKDTQEASDLPLALYLMENFSKALTIQ